MKILLIAIHYRQDYLTYLLSLMEKQNINNTITIKKKGIACSLIDKKASFLFQKGTVSSRYDKVLAAIVENRQKAEYLLDLIETDANLRLSDVEDKGFIGTVPFLQQ